MDDWVVENGGRKGYITEELQKLLKTASNHHILHIPKE
jgi:hypothetical protein